MQVLKLALQMLSGFLRAGGGNQVQWSLQDENNLGLANGDRSDRVASVQTLGYDGLQQSHHCRLVELTSVPAYANAHADATISANADRQLAYLENTGRPDSVRMKKCLECALQTGRKHVTHCVA